MAPKKTQGAPGHRVLAKLAQLEKEHPPETVARLRRMIQGQVIIERLMGHVRGEIELLPTQIQAALGLLNRILPALQSVQVDVKEDDRLTVIRAPERSPTAEAWQQLIEHKTIEHKSNGHSD